MKRSRDRRIKESIAAYQVEPLLTKVTRQGQITLPSDVRRQLHIKEGDLMEVTIEGDRVVMMPKRLIDKSQAYFWTEGWQRGEREAEADIRAGRVKRFKSAEDLIADIES
ncbi:MAG: AbrB/MazE/SpoVT family DNA-binding domain-containing protein [Chloroflexi bacterium]|nr:AbrB/MazE/SpoVT family DNA-binding domain-containing protein [Chloroflexota bacterium]